MAADTDDQPKGFQVKDRRRFTESGEFPIRISGRVFNLFQTLRADFFCKLTGALRLADQQIHGCGVNSGPIAAGRLISLIINFSRAFQKCFAFTWAPSSRREIFQSAGEHPERLLVRLAFVAQFSQNNICALSRTAPSKRESLELSQANILRPFH